MASLAPPPEVPDGAPADRPTPAVPNAGQRRGRWELIIALALAVTTITGAMFTYVSVQRESAAADADQQAIIETILVEQRHAAAATQTYALGGLAARYRRLMADAEALAPTDPQRAAVTRQVANALAAQSGIYEFLVGADASSRFNYDAKLDAALHYSDVLAVPDDQPARTAALADAHRDASRMLALCAVGMLVIVVLLTLARVGRRQWRRTALFAVACVGYVATVVVAIPQVA